VSPPRNAPNSARRSEKSRRAILTAALDLLEESGYAKLSIEGIAARAGVGKQTIYRWWPSKGSVLLDALLALSEDQEGEVVALPDTGDLEADLKLILRATIAQLNDPRYDQPMRALSTEILHDPELAAIYAERLDRPMTELRQERLRSARRAGELPPEFDLALAVDMIWGPLFNRWALRTGPLTPEYADALVETALDGLRPRATTTVT
jgi:AcrR family transcriptional regulator